MPVGKSAYLRYRIINSCLANKRKRYWTIPELIGKLEDHDILVERRTVESDFQQMRYDERLGYHAPIQYCRKNKGHYYTDPAYSIDALPLSEEDVQAFGVLVSSLQKFKGARVVNQLEGVFDKLGKVVEQLKKKGIPRTHPIIDFEKVPYYKGIEFFDAVLNAVHHQQTLQIDYKKFDHDHADTHVFHPYLLKEYKSRWYTLGFSELRKAYIILALDRMENISEENVPFKENDLVDVQAYFHHTIGVTLAGGDVEEIELWFSPPQGNYIKTLHLHHTQKIIEDSKDGLRITLQLIPNYELMQLLLSYGQEVKVLKPLSLQEKIKAMLQKGYLLYDD